MTPLTFAGGTLDELVNASAIFSAAIVQQRTALQSKQSPTTLAEKTVSYAVAKTAYYQTLRAAAPELMDIATGKEPRPPELDQFARAFSIAGEKQERAADQETTVLLQRLSFDPDIERARAEFDRGQAVEERFHKDFDGVDFSARGADPIPALPRVSGRAQGFLS